MNTAILMCISLAVLLDTGLSLQCHQCTSSRGWWDCDERMVSKECPSIADRCAKIKQTTNYQGSKLINYDRKCYVKDACGDFCKRFADQGVACEINCCEGDLCNAASVPVASGFLLWTCSVVGLFVQCLQ